MSLIEKAIKMVDIERLYTHVLHLEGIKHPLDSYNSLMKATSYIENEFNNYKMFAKRDFFSIEGFNEPFFNVESFFRKTDQINFSLPIYLVTSHFDTVYNSPGADDNASAIAIMLEVARVLKKLDFDKNIGFVSFNLEEGSPFLEQQIRKLAIEAGIYNDSNQIKSWRMKQLFNQITARVREISGRSFCDEKSWKNVESAFKADLSRHEIEFFRQRNDLYRKIAKDDWVGKTALLGSGEWVKKAKRANLNIKGVINLESVGFTSMKSHSQWLPQGISLDFFKRHKIDEESMIGNFLSIIVDDTSSELGSILFNSCTHELIDLPCALLNLPLDYKSISLSFPDLLRSDHAPFWLNGFPAAMLTDTANFRNPYYHTGGDMIQTLDFVFMKKICQVVILALIEKYSG